MFGFIKKLFGEPTNFKQLVLDGAMIIDVRTPAEFKGGHIKGSTNIPLDKIKNKTQELHSKGKAIITVCRSGSRSGMAKNILKSAGIQVYNGGPWNSLQGKIR
ncbi:MAG: rhodanese-like domain-containing protein [Bacteroidia bacterium]